MKKSILILASIVTICSSFYYEWWFDIGEYLPVFMERTELEKSVFYITEGRELEDPGKIYYKSPFIFINERYKGVQLIDNSNPASPQNVGYIVAPGCLDIAVKDNVIYLDNAVDLVAFDLDSKKVTAREKKVFPEPMAPNGSYYTIWHRPSETAIVVGWKKTRIEN